MDLRTKALNSFLIDNVSKEVFMNYRCAPQFTNTTQPSVQHAVRFGWAISSCIDGSQREMGTLPMRVACCFSCKGSFASAKRMQKLILA